MSLIPEKISAVISDVDGTLVTTEKTLTPEAIDAVTALRARGIPFALISSRPPRGMERLLKPLGIATPVTGFNGGLIVSPDMRVLEEHTLDPAVARKAVEMLSARGISVWVFNGEDWFIRDRNGPHVDHEIHTVGFQPTLVERFGAALDKAAKIVGVSDEFDILAHTGDAVREVLGTEATVALSQRYYLDITHPRANKGDAVISIARLLGIPIEEVVVIGDAENDIAMFAKTPLSVAMGNANEQVRSHAHYLTRSNQHNGFSWALRHYVLGESPEETP